MLYKRHNASGPSGGGLLGRTSLNKGDRTGNSWTLQRWAPIFFSCSDTKIVVPGSMEHPASLLLRACLRHTVQVRWWNTVWTYQVNTTNYMAIYHLEYGGHIHQMLLKTKPLYHSTVKMGLRCHLCSLQLSLHFRYIYDGPVNKWWTG